MRIKNLFRIFMLACICTAIVSSVSFSTFAEEKKEKIKHESGIYYTIQKGDTLWDLSQRFYDSPAFWPGLWEENNQIPNPHWIYPGERIRLYHQSGIQQVEFIKKIKKEPTKEEPAPKPEIKKEPPYYYYSLNNRIGFVKKEPVTPKGTIFRARDDKVMISTGDIVYVKPKKHYTLALGEKHTVYRTFESARGKKSQEYINLYGTQYYLVGVLEIIDNAADYQIARVTQTYRHIRVNDLLMPYKSRSPKIYLAESKEGISGQIIFNEDRDRMFGDNSVAFIDKGARDGIAPGQFYSVFYRGKHGLKFTEKKEMDPTPVDFGTVLVLHTEKNTSTVLVTYSEKDMYSTALIRTPLP